MKVETPKVNIGSQSIRTSAVRQQFLSSIPRNMPAFPKPSTKKAKNTAIQFLGEKSTPDKLFEMCETDAYSVLPDHLGNLSRMHLPKMEGSLQDLRIAYFSPQAFSSEVWREIISNNRLDILLIKFEHLTPARKKDIWQDMPTLKLLTIEGNWGYNYMLYPSRFFVEDLGIGINRFNIGMTSESFSFNLIVLIENLEIDTDLLDIEALVICDKAGSQAIDQEALTNFARNNELSYYWPVFQEVLFFNNAFENRFRAKNFETDNLCGLNVYYFERHLPGEGIYEEKVSAKQFFNKTFVQEKIKYEELRAIRHEQIKILDRSLTGNKFSLRTQPEIVIKEPIIDLMGNRISGELVNGSYKCGICTQSFKDSRLLIAHFYSRHEKPKCPFCEARTQNLPDLNKHYKLWHSSDNCNLCSYKGMKLEGSIKEIYLFFDHLMKRHPYDYEC